MKILTFWGENVQKCQFKIISRTRNAPRISTEREIE